MEGKILFINCHGFKPVAIDKKIGMTAGQVFFKNMKLVLQKIKKIRLVLTLNGFF